MKHLKTKREITSRNLKEGNCNYKGFRLGFDKNEDAYVVGSHFQPRVDFFETIEDLKLTFS